MPAVKRLPFPAALPLPVDGCEAPPHVPMPFDAGARAARSSRHRTRRRRTRSPYQIRRVSRRRTTPYDRCDAGRAAEGAYGRSEEHTSELQSLMRISYAVFCLKKKKTHTKQTITYHSA